MFPVCLQVVKGVLDWSSVKKAKASGAKQPYLLHMARVSTVLCVLCVLCMCQYVGFAANLPCAHHVEQVSTFAVRRVARAMHLRLQCCTGASKALVTESRV